MTQFILSTKTIPNLKLFHNSIATLVPEFDGILANEDEITILLTSEVTPEIIAVIESIIPPSQSQIEIVKKIIYQAQQFGQILVAEFAAENVLMGITQEGMTGTVRKNMREVIDALSTGSLYDAIDEARLIPSDKKDLKYITNARLLQFINKIETYLNIPLSSSL